MFFQTVCGIDLGTDTIKIRDKSGHYFLYDKNVIAKRGNSVIAVGEVAYDFYEKTPENVKVIWPMTGGVIASSTEMEQVLYHLLKRFRGFGGRDNVIYIAVPGNITQVEKRAFFHVMSSKISAGKVHLIEKGIADAVGAGTDVFSSKGHMVVNIGADTTEIAVISGGRVIISQTLKLGGRRLDEDILTMVRRKFNLNIGRKSAEQLKNNLAFMINGPKLEQKVFGIHTLSGLPKSEIIPSLAVSVAIVDTVDAIVDNVRAVFNRLPPQIMGDVADEGIYLTGGVSMILNLDEYFRQELNVRIVHVPDPAYGTIRGIVGVMNDSALRKLTWSLRDLSTMR